MELHFSVVVQIRERFNATLMHGNQILFTGKSKNESKNEQSGSFQLRIFSKSESHRVIVRIHLIFTIDFRNRLNRNADPDSQPLHRIKESRVKRETTLNLCANTRKIDRFQDQLFSPLFSSLSLLNDFPFISVS